MTYGNAGTYDIIKAVARHRELEPGDLTGPSRKAETVLARQMAMYLMVERGGIPSVDAGTALNRDHSTVLYGARSMAKRMEADSEIRREVEIIADWIQGAREATAAQMQEAQAAQLHEGRASQAHEAAAARRQTG